MVAKRVITIAVLLVIVGLRSANAEAAEADGSESGVAPKSPLIHQSIDPATAETLTPEQARRLTASAGAVLSLPRLQVISEEAARELATYRDESREVVYTVSVPYTEEITRTYTVMEEYAEEIVREDGTKASVSKSRPVQKTRSVAVTKCRMEERSRFYPLTLQLDGLATAKPQVMAALASHDGHLHLNGLRSITPDEATALVPHKGGTLALDGLATLDIRVAKRLAAREGSLSLNGITSLALGTAKALCSHKGVLSLNGLAILDGDLAAVIATHKGAVSLKGVKEASEEAITALGGRPVVLPQELLATSKKGNK